MCVYVCVCVCACVYVCVCVCVPAGFGAAASHYFMCILGRRVSRGAQVLLCVTRRGTQLSEHGAHHKELVYDMLAFSHLISGNKKFALLRM